MSVYKVTAKQTYYVEADTPEEAQLSFIEENEHVGIGFTEVIDVELEQEDERWIHTSMKSSKG